MNGRSKFCSESFDLITTFGFNLISTFESGHNSESFNLLTILSVSDSTIQLRPTNDEASNFFFYFSG
jgi:hypothetical protein